MMCHDSIIFNLKLHDESVYKQDRQKHNAPALFLGKPSFADFIKMPSFQAGKKLQGNVF